MRNAYNEVLAADGHMMPLKSSSCIRWWCLVALSLAYCGGARARPGPALCAPGEEDPRALRFCSALNTFLELYAESAGTGVGVGVGEQMQPDYQALVRDYPQLLDTGMKRQDVVHSFLRFGRRR